MKVDYKNWVPKGLIFAVAAALVVMATIGIIIKYIFVRIIVGILCVGLFGVLLWLVAMYKAFDYRGKRQMSRQIIAGIAEYVKVPAGGSCLENKTPYLIHFNGIAA